MQELSPQQRIIISGYLNNHGVNTIVDCMRKVVSGDKIDSITRSHVKESLGPYKNHLRKIVNSNDLKVKREIIPKVGAGLGSIIAIAIPILLEFARKKKWI